MIKKLEFLVGVIRRPAAWLLIIGMVLMVSSVMAAPPCDAPLDADAVLCLESDQDVTSFNGAVTAWSDQSGSGNDLIARGTPTIGDVTTPTGEPAISFSGGGSLAGGGVNYSDWINGPDSDVVSTMSNTFAASDEWPFTATDNQSISLSNDTPGTHVWGFGDMSGGPGENKGWRLLAMLRTSSGTGPVNVDVTLRNNGVDVSTHPTVRITSTSDNIYAFFFPDVDTSGTTFNAPEIELTYTRQGVNTSFRVGGLLLSRSPVDAEDEAVGYGALAGSEVQAFRSSDLVRLGGLDNEEIVHWPDATGRGQHVGVTGAGDNATLQISGSDSWVNFDNVRFAGVIDSAVTGDLARMVRYRFDVTGSDQVMMSQATTGGAGDPGGMYAGRWDNSIPKLASSPGITDKIVAAVSDGGGGGFEDMIMAGDGSGPAHIYSGVAVAGSTWFKRTDFVQQAGNEKVWRNDEASPIIDAAGVSSTNDLMRISIGNRENDERPMDGDISEIWHYDMSADGGRVEADIDDARDAWVVSSDGPGDKLERTASLSGLPTGNADRTMFVVARYDSVGIGGYAYGNPVDNETFGLGVDGSGDLMLYGRGAANNFSSAMAGNGAGWKIQSVIKSGDSLSHYVDGSLVDSQSHTQSTVADRIVLGADIDSALFVDSDIAAVLIYDRALSGPEHTQVEDYLEAKYISSSTVPGVPQNLAATPGDTEVDLAWDAPASDGGSAITEYLVEYKANSSGIWLDANHNSAATTATVTGLTNGTLYDFRISAINANGTGSPTATESATPSGLPGVPQNLAATPGDTEVDLAWDAPASDGGSAITEYLVEYKANSSGIWLDANHNSAATTATVTGLTNGTLYDFRISAINANGTGSPTATESATPSGLPGVPQNLAATPGDTEVDLAWDAPASDGGSAITEYLVEYKANSSGIWLDANHNSAATTATVTGLTNGTLYDFRISAINANGTGSPTATESATPSGLPGVPQNLAATPGDTEVDLAWDAPASDGGSAITEYLVEYKANSSGIWLDANHNSAATTATVTGLTNGTLYDFRISAINANGTGSPTATESATPSGLPGVPQNLAATPGDTEVDLAWDAPASDGGSAITEYLVEYKANSSGIWLDANHNSAATTATVTGLTNGTLYDFRISAINANGTGSPTATESATPSGLPGVPQNLAATPGDTEVDLAWDAPASDGGSAITEYLVEYKANSSGIWLDANHNSAATTATVTGLTNGTLYDFRISAINANGTGSPTATESATPSGLPGVPQNLAATPGDTEVDLAWDAPASDGGSAITEYLVEYKANSSGIWLDANHNSAATTATVTGLTNGTLYDFRISAINANGTGSPTATESATPSGLPGVPQNLAATPGDTEVDLAWDAPASDGGSAITEYLVEYKANSSGIWLDANHNSAATTATVTGLTNGTLYDFRISAINANGTGSPTATESATPSGLPGVPQNLAATPGDTEVDLAWDAPASDGGSAITEYLVEYKANSSGIWLDANHNSAATTATVTGLTNGTLYDFRISAINANGTGSPTATESATPSGLPGVPQNLAATPGDTEVDLAWDAPASDGGSAITEYLVEYKANSSGIWLDANHNSAATTATVTGLTNGTLYDFRISAINANGTGSPTATESATPSGLPGVPQNLAATPGDTEVDLAWDAPASDGGSAITEYLVEYKANSSGIWLDANHNSAATTATVTGLTNGTLYDFRISAINANGTGSPTATESATPSGLPGVPQNLAATPGDTEVDLAWDAPASDGGSAITEYLVEYKANSSGIWLDANHNSAATTATVTGLTNGTLYDFRISAINANGTGSPTATESATPSGLPGVPQNLAATPGDTEVDLAWDAPASDGGSAITEYLVEYKANSSGIWLDANHNSAATTATVTGLTNGTLYDFRISAINANGTGSPTATESATPSGLPGVPQNLAATPGDTEVDLAWDAPASDGGSAITEYLVEYKANSSGIWLDANHNSAATTATVTGLTNGTLYDFRISAINANGTGSPTATESATPSGLPGVPQNLAATPGDTEVDLAWDAPASDGGSAITEYLVEYKANSSGIWLDANHNSAATTATVTGLTNGTLYDFRISAINANGTGSPTAVASVTPTSSATAPQNLSAVPSDRQVALDWDTPVSDGGSAITEYLVEYKLSSAGSWTDANHNSLNTDIIISGLANGSAYDFRVAAVTDSTGSFATIVNVTPFTDVPNLGDANDDGTHDVDQQHVDGLFSSITGDYVVLEVDSACEITALSLGAESINTAQDSEFNYPLGMMSFTIDCDTPGYETTITQYYYDAEDNGYVMRKHNPNSNAYFGLTDAVIGQTTIDGTSVLTAAYQATDGGVRDTDGAEDGIIIDPAGLALAIDNEADTDLTETGSPILLGSLVGSGIATVALLSRRRSKKVKFKHYS